LFANHQVVTALTNCVSTHYEDQGAVRMQKSIIMLKSIRSVRNVLV